MSFYLLHILNEGYVIKKHRGHLICEKKRRGKTNSAGRLTRCYFSGERYNVKRPIN